MTDEKHQSSPARLGRLVAIGLGLPWIEALAELWKLGRKLLRGLAHEGMYEVLEYESTLELLDKRGKRAHFSKREKVRYLQDNIIAYQDSAWADGKYLLNYHCTPGKSVDQYQPGHKTIILISLREVKHRGDVDEFHIEWDMQDSFIRKTEMWGTQVSHRTKSIKHQIIFPKTRPPLRVSVVEKTRQKTQILGGDAKVKLSDGRWLVSWETSKPRLNESYLFKWDW